MHPCLRLLCLLAAFVPLAPVGAEEWPTDRGGVYVGAFGGAGTLESTSLRQRGQVILPAPLPHLPIDADGGTGRESLWLAGVQLGYGFAPWRPAGSAWGLRPALELEAIHLGKHTPEGEMPVSPRVLGTQYVTMPMTGRVLMASAVVAVETPWSQRVLPYLGVGAGHAWISVRGSDSANPGEPGINHFNSDPDASDSAFALQFKAGLRAELSPRVSIFGEYRHLRIDATRYGFGPTDYPGLHLPTASWDVDMGRLKYNLFVAGLQYRF